MQRLNELIALESELVNRDIQIAELNQELEETKVVDGVHSHIA
jgi:hypothetical protein